MEKHEFIYTSTEGEEYRLVVTEQGFEFYDKRSGELLIDGSMLVSLGGTHIHYWPVEIEISLTNRDFYFSKKDDKVQFGLTRRE